LRWSIVLLFLLLSVLPSVVLAFALPPIMLPFRLVFVALALVLVSIAPAFTLLQMVLASIHVLVLNGISGGTFIVVGNSAGASLGVVISWPIHGPACWHLSVHSCSSWYLMALVRMVFVVLLVSCCWAICCPLAGICPFMAIHHCTWQGCPQVICKSGKKAILRYFRLQIKI
jgi:hypothetical protein